MYLKQQEESEKKKLEKIKDDYNKFFKYIEDESVGIINYNLFEGYFHFSVPRALPKEFYKIKNKSNKLVNIIKSSLIDLKTKIEENISK